MTGILSLQMVESSWPWSRGYSTHLFVIGKYPGRSTQKRSTGLENRRRDTWSTGLINPDQMRVISTQEMVHILTER